MLSFNHTSLLVKTQHRTAPRMCTDQSAASVMTTSPRHHAPPKTSPAQTDVTGDSRSGATLSPQALYCYPENERRKTKPVIRKDRKQTNPKPTLQKWSRRPTRNKQLRGDRDPPPPPTPVPAGNPYPNNHMTHGMTRSDIYKYIKKSQANSWKMSYCAFK